MRTKIEIIGAGVMGSAIAHALRKNSRSYRLSVADQDKTKARRLAAAIQGHTDLDLARLSGAKFVVLAVKPQDLEALALCASGKIQTKTLLVSIAAGVPVKKLQQLFSHQKVVRVMPNLGLAVGQGIAAWIAAKALTNKDKKNVKFFLTAITDNFEVRSETLIDAVTAVSGSGPAYFFYFAQVIMKTGAGLGLSMRQSRILTEKTLLAAAFLQIGHNYPNLIAKVASKEGTTEKALQVMQRRGLEKIIRDAIHKAYLRTKELAK